MCTEAGAGSGEPTTNNSEEWEYFMWNNEIVFLNRLIRLTNPGDDGKNFQDEFAVFEGRHISSFLVEILGILIPNVVRLE